MGRAGIWWRWTAGRRGRLAAAATAALAAAAAFVAGAAPAQAAEPAEPAELIVRFDGRATAAAQRALLERVGARSVRAHPLPDTYVARLARRRDVFPAVRTLSASRQVRWAESNDRWRLHAIPNDPGFRRQWALRNVGQTVDGWRSRPGVDIDVLRPWNTLVGSRQILVGVADTGIDRDHPDLRPNLRTDLGRNFVPNFDGTITSNDWSDVQGHGTHVAGIIGAVGNNRLGVSGVNWRVGLVPLRACYGVGCDDADISAAFAYAGLRGLHVVNASLGTDDYSQALVDSIRLSRRTLFVVAAGNEKRSVDRKPEWPCSIQAPNVVCVGASTAQDRMAPFSNWGRRTVDLFAPGTQILSTGVRTAAPFAESFEQPLAGRWVTGGTGDDWGIVRVRLNTNFEVPVLSSAASGAPNPPDTNSFISTIEPIDLRSYHRCTMTVGPAQLELARGDVLLFERSDDGRTWHTFDSLTRSSPDDDEVYEVNADEMGGRASRLRIRLRASSAPDPTRRVVIGDIVIQCMADQPRRGFYQILSGTSQATPFVAGTAALLLARRPSLRVAELRRALLGGVVRRSAFARRSVSGGRLDVRRSLALVEGRSLAFTGSRRP